MSPQSDATPITPGRINPGRRIVDAHLHLWDPGTLSYSWLRGDALLDRAYSIEDYRQACGGLNVEAMVFVECMVDASLSEAEVRFVEHAAQCDPRVRAIVAQAPLEQGLDVLSHLERLRDGTARLRGVRRIIEVDPDLDFCLGSKFIAAVRALPQLDLSFDITVNHRHMSRLPRFVERVGSDVQLMLDHCGKPAIRERRIEPWRTQLRALAEHPNVFCKLSGLATEAARDGWTAADVQPYIDAAVEAFGFERLVFGGDWPVCLGATTLTAWVEVLDRCFSGVPPADLERFYRGNAWKFYRLGTLERSVDG